MATKIQKWHMTENMLGTLCKRVDDYLDEGRSGGDGEWQTMENLQKVFHEANAKFLNNEPDNAASVYVHGTLTYMRGWEPWSSKLGVDLNVLRWRLLDMDGKNYHNVDKCHWDDWAPERLI